MATLVEMFTEIANAIRNKTGETGLIKATDFQTKINGVTTLSEGTKDATATAEDVTIGKTTYSKGVKLEGTYVHPTALIVAGQSVPIVECDATGVAPELDATVNDVREGKKAMTNQGVLTGEKVIPSYHTSEGKALIMSGETFSIPLPSNDKYDYTAIQIIICPFNTSAKQSVSAEKVGIEDKVYNVNTTTAVSSITKDAVNKSINLGITNSSESTYMIRYFTYKEIK